MADDNSARKGRRPVSPWSMGKPQPMRGGDNTFHSDLAASTPRLTDGLGYGFRAWRVHLSLDRKVIRVGAKKNLQGPAQWVDDPRNGMLTGLFQVHYTYGPGENVANCAYHEHRAPHINLLTRERCGCGFYHFASTDHPDAAPNNHFRGNSSLYVQGIAQTGGRHVFGSKGYVSERSRIVALLPIQGGGYSNHLYSASVDRYMSRLSTLVRQNYPDVAWFDDETSMLRAFPLTQLPKPPERGKPQFGYGTT